MAGERSSRLPMLPAEQRQVAPIPASTTVPAPRDGVIEVDLGEVLARIWRRGYIVVACALLGLVGSVALALTLEPTYTAYSRLMLENRRTEIRPAQAVVPDLTPTSEIVETEIELLLSRSILERVAQRLDVARIAAAREAESESGFRLGNLFSREVLAGLLPADWNGWLVAEDELAPLRLDSGLDEGVRFLAERVTAAQIGSTAVMEIAVKDVDPVLAATIANTLASEYLTAQLSWKIGATTGANEWLAERIEELRAELGAKRAELETLRAAVGVVDESASSLIAQQQTFVNERLVEARAERIRLEAQVRGLEQALAERGVGAVGTMLGSNVVADLKVAEAQLAARVAELATIYGPRHSARIDAEAQLASVRNELQLHVRQSVEGLRNQLNAERAKELELEAQLARFNESAAQQGDGRTQLVGLQTEVAAMQQLLDSYLTRYKETAEQTAIIRPDARVISSSVPPTDPDFPNKKLIVLLGFLVSSAGGVCLAFLRDGMDRTLRDTAGSQRLLGVPVAHALPTVPKRWFRQPRPADHVVERPGSAFAEALCSLYASVARLAPSGRPMRLMVTSAVPGEGKTSTAAALARLLQRSGQRVVLVEGDLRRPQLARMLGTGQGPGLVELLRGSAEPSEVVHEDPVTSLALIPAGRPANDAYFLLGSSNMARVVDALARDFDIVIIDCAPVLPVADTRALVDHVDAAIFLCRWGVTPSEVVARGIETLRSAAAVPVVGVLAQVDLKRFSRYERGYDYAAAAQYYRD